MQNLQLANEGLSLIEQVSEYQRIVTGATAVLQLLHHTPQLNAYLIAQHQSADLGYGYSDYATNMLYDTRLNMGPKTG
jgi:hypothetical protein